MLSSNTPSICLFFVIRFFKVYIFIINFDSIQNKNISIFSKNQFLASSKYLFSWRVLKYYYHWTVLITELLNVIIVKDIRNINKYNHYILATFFVSVQSLYIYRSHKEYPCNFSLATQSCQSNFIIYEIPTGMVIYIFLKQTYNYPRSWKSTDLFLVVSW